MEKKPITLLYAEWAIKHATIIRETADKLSGNINMIGVIAAMNEELEKLAAADENYELAIRVVFPEWGVREQTNSDDGK